MQENQTEPSLSQSAPTHSDELDAELKPWIYDLLDIRVIMFLISTGVIAMTVTVLFAFRRGRSWGERTGEPG